MARTTTNTAKKREARAAVAQKRRDQTRLRWGLLGLLGLVVVGGLIWLLSRQGGGAQLGEEVAVASRDHVPEGSDSGPYATDPPAGGKHYPSTYQPGFYDEEQASQLPANHEGYLVHNLEHGYVIFWYNCAADPNLSCDDLKASIRKVMDSSGTHKLIAFPWPSI